MAITKNPALCLLATILTCLPVLVFGGEFASWWQKTPGGNTIGYEKHSDEYQTVLYCSTDGSSYQPVRGLARWYFLNNHIVGIRKIDSSTQYFIFNELTCVFEACNNRTEFENKLNARKLVPRFWTRWYDTNWGVIISCDGFEEGILLVLFKFPVIVLFLTLFSFLLVRTRFDLSQLPNKIGLVILGAVLLRVLLDVVPDSI